MKQEFRVRGCLSKPRNSQFYQAILIYTDPSGREIRRSITTKQSDKDQAGIVMEKMAEELEAGIYHKASSDSLFADFLDYWLENFIPGRVQQTTLNGYRMNVINHIAPFFRSQRIRLKNIKAKHIYCFMNKKTTEGNLKPQSINKFIANIASALDYAISLDLINYNPARDVIRLKCVPFETKPYTLSQINELLTLCQSTKIWPGVFLTAIYGFRRGEILGLKWKNIDFENKVIYINESRTMAQAEIIKTVKTSASKRAMPMLNVVEKYLNGLREELGANYDEDNYLVTSANNEKMPVVSFSKQFRVIVDNSALPEIRFHDLRHSIAAYLLSNGESIEFTSIWLGHSSVVTTAKYYSHFKTEDRLKTAGKLNSVFEPIIASLAEPQYTVPQKLDSN